MINLDSQLKLQAYADRQLPENERGPVADWVARDQEAKVFLEELTIAKRLIRENEPQYALPETREFFWSKIERQIAPAGIAPGAESARLSAGSMRWWLLRVGAPLAGVAAALALIWNSNRWEEQPSATTFHEIEFPIEGASMISFRSESAGMTVVWMDTRKY